MEKPSYISLTQYFKGEASEEVATAVKTWEEANKKEFDELRSIWEKYGSLATSYQPDLNKAWSKIDERTQEANGISTGMILRIAAMIVVAVGLGWMIQSGWFSASPSTAFQAINENLTVDLDDETIVTLSKGSKLRAAEGFGVQNRRVVLEGKGYFDVKRNEEMPFIVEVGKMRVSVLGTSFQIDQSITLTEVIVTDGRVEVQVADERIILNEGEKAALNSLDQSLITSDEISGNAMAWKSGVLRFSNTSLQDLAKDLESFYGVDIQVNETLNDRQITAKFNNQSLAEVFEIVQASLDVRIDTLDHSHFEMN